MRNGWLFSAFLHLLLLAFWLLVPSAPHEVVVWNAQAPTKPESLEVRTLSEKQFQSELKDALEETEAQVVAGDDQLKTEKAGERKGKTLLSKHNQQVDEETQAARLGKYKNNLKEGAREAGGGQTAGGDDVPPPKPEIAKLFELPRDAKDIEPTTALTRNTGRLRSPASIDPAPGDKKGEGLSATEDYLKDVAVGANTLLNTKEFRFYGFYERIREKLSYRWRQNLDVAFKKIISERRNLGAGEQTTQVHVKMGPLGQVVSVRVTGSSGYEELDEAALVAFREAGPFPNPPAEMLDAQKNVTIRWDFVVLGDDSAGPRVQVRQRTW